MYLHLGQNTVVRFQDVIGIFDIENASLSKYTKSFLFQATKKDQVFNVSYEMPKSFIVCKNEKGTVVYISQISSQTLLKRQMTGITGIRCSKGKRMAGSKFHVHR